MAPAGKSRSELMKKIRRENTGPELDLRRILHAAGYRYRLHVKSLPGTPDIVLPSRKKVIFVHGCFWHGHESCKLATVPKTRVTFWCEKISSNRSRDARKVEALKLLGWNSIVVWQCELRNPDAVLARLRNAIGDRNG